MGRLSGEGGGEGVRVVVDVVVDEGRDEKVAVVIALLHSHVEGDPAIRGGARGRERFGLELVDGAGQEVVRSALVDEKLQRPPRVPTHEQSRVVLRTRFDGAEVACEGLFAPRAVGRVADWREGGGRCVGGRVLERERERAVPAHRVTGDAFWARKDLAGEGRLNE